MPQPGARRDNPKAIQLHCDDDNDAICICFRCRETIVVPPPPFDDDDNFDENDDNDGSWLLNHKRTADEVERLKNADHVQKKVRFIDGDELMQECMRSSPSMKRTFF